MVLSATDRRELISAARLSIYSNSALVIAKLFVGFFTLSISVISEAIHSGMDLLAALIANYSVQRSTRPADATHEFGHGKYESLSGSIEAMLIFVAALLIVFEAINRLLDHSAVQIVEAGIVVMGLSAVVNLFISRRLMRVAKKHESLALEADALHLKTDVWTSTGVFFGLLIIWFTGIHEIDAIIAIAVAIMIIAAAAKLTRRSARELLDHSLTSREIRVIEVVVARVAGDMATYHGLRTRRSGRERFVDFHLVVPSNMPVERAHKICDDIEKEVVIALPNSNLSIHIEPCNRECDNCDRTEVCKGPG